MTRVSSDQPKRENAFGRSCARLRKHMHLTQRDMAEADGNLFGLQPGLVPANNSAHRNSRAGDVRRAPLNTGCPDD